MKSFSQSNTYKTRIWTQAVFGSRAHALNCYFRLPLIIHHDWSRRYLFALSLLESLKSKSQFWFPYTRSFGGNHALLLRTYYSQHSQQAPWASCHIVSGCSQSHGGGGLQRGPGECCVRSGFVSHLRNPDLRKPRSSKMSNKPAWTFPQREKSSPYYTGW